MAMDYWVVASDATISVLLGTGLYPVSNSVDDGRLPGSNTPPTDPRVYASAQISLSAHRPLLPCLFNIEGNISDLLRPAIPTRGIDYPGTFPRIFSVKSFSEFFGMSVWFRCRLISGRAYGWLLGGYTLPTLQNPNYSHGRPPLGGSPGRGMCEPSLYLSPPATLPRCRATSYGSNGRAARRLLTLPGRA